MKELLLGIGIGIVIGHIITYERLKYLQRKKELKK